MSQTYQTRAKPDTYRARSSEAKRPSANRKDGGIPQKIYIPYRALAMLAFTFAIVLGMLALLRENSSPLSDTDKLAASTQTSSTPSVEISSAKSDDAATAKAQKINICVFNAGKQIGYGARVVNALQGANFTIEGEAQNLDHPPTNRTTIYYPTDHREEAIKVGQIVKEAQIKLRPTSLSVCPDNIVVLLV